MSKIVKSVDECDENTHTMPIKYNNSHFNDIILLGNHKMHWMFLITFTSVIKMQHVSDITYLVPILPVGNCIDSAKRKLMSLLCSSCYPRPRTSVFEILDNSIARFPRYGNITFFPSRALLCGALIINISNNRQRFARSYDSLIIP